MNHRKNIWLKLLFPPVWLILLLTVCSAAALIAVFVNGWDTSPVAYAVYVLSFYALSVFCLACWKTFPGYYRSIRGKVYDNRYASRYLTDPVFRTHVSLYTSLGINLLYAAVNAISAAVYSTAWFGIFAVYYVIMAVMRFLLLRYVNRNAIGKSRLGELKRSRLCACILMLVNLILTGAVLMMVTFGRGFSYQGILIYVMALYTFYVTVSAIISLFRYKKLGSPVMSVSKIIQFAQALVSMLFLETAMFAQFGGDMAPEHQRLMIMLTGGGIAVAVAIMAVYVIVRSTKEIQNRKQTD
ncbi:MAG: hypothetical protein E7631_04205 [Ruminococcaceae bacterium]|nr:hypothetical protein [Oscillospiraceae bacterium]